MESSIIDSIDGKMGTKPTVVDTWNQLDRELDSRLKGIQNLNLDDKQIELISCDSLCEMIETNRTTSLPHYDVLFPWLHGYSDNNPPAGMAVLSIIRSRQAINGQHLEDSGILKNSMDPTDLFVSWFDPLNDNLLQFYTSNRSIMDNLKTITQFLSDIIKEQYEKIKVKLEEYNINLILKLCIHFRILPFLKTDILSIKRFCDSSIDKVAVNRRTKNSSETIWKQHTNSFRRFDLQCAKILELSSTVVIYCFNVNEQDEHAMCSHCRQLIILLKFALDIIKSARVITNSCDDTNNFSILNYGGVTSIPDGLIGTPLLDISVQQDPNKHLISPFDIISFNNWDRAFKIHEKLEIAKVSSRSCIDLPHSFWCGNTTDYRILKFFLENENNLNLLNDKIHYYYSPENSITTALELKYDKDENPITYDKILFNIPFSKNKENHSQILNLFIRCSENASLLPTDKLWQILETCLKRDMEANDLNVSFPSSGSIGLGSLNISSISGILNMCFFMYLISQKTDFKTLLYCNDGFTETSFLLVVYLIFLWDLPLEEVLFKLSEECERPFYLFQSDIQVLSHLQLLVRSFSPTIEENRLKYMNDKTKIPAPLEISSEMFSNVFFIKIPKTVADLNKLNGPLPSRILSHMYLGALEHAQSPELLKKMGITHIVSVGETISWVKQHSVSQNDMSRNRGMSTTARLPNGYSNGLNIRTQRSATITNTDMKILSHTTSHEFTQDGFKIFKVNNLQDNGHDSITDQLTDISKFIDDAYTNNSRVLVHCMVGVSRSATVCIAECMKRLNCELLKAYLYVRVRRLNIVIQPNLMFIYELMKWQEVLGIERSMDWNIVCRNITELNRKFI